MCASTKKSNSSFKIIEFISNMTSFIGYINNTVIKLAHVY